MSESGRERGGLVKEVIDRAAEAIDTDRVVELARQLCAVPSGERNDGAPPGEGPRAEIVADALDRDGIEVHVADVVEGRPNVIARVRGTGDRPPLVLQGHIDAGVYPDGWSHDPHDPWQDSGRLYGGGVSDMLGGVAAMVAAVEAAPDVGPLPGDLVLHATMHHDGTGLGAKYALLTEGPTEGYAVNGEPSGLAIHTGNGGAFKFEIRLEGTPAHVSRMESAIDTLGPAVAIYSALVDHEFAHVPEPRLPDLPRLLIGQLLAGRAAAAVAEETVIRGDLRSVPGMNRTEVKREIVDIVNRVLPPDVGRRVRITGIHQPYLGATSGPLIDAITAAHEQILGATPQVTNELPGQAFVTDAADLVAAGLETVVYGVGEWYAAPDEWILIDELAGSARVYLAAAALLGAGA